jgi:hypothetical protein
MMRVWPFLWAGVIVVGLVVFFSGKPSPDVSTEEAPGWHDLVTDRKFDLENPGMLKAITALIVKSGYSCPALSSLLVKGPSPYGVRLEALCGPDDGKRSTYPEMHYAVYPEKFKVHLCSEYGIFAKECK